MSASQSAIAEGGSIVTADAMNFQQKMYSHPTYVYNPQYPNTFGQAIYITAGQTPSTINIPPEVIYLSKSYLVYQVVIPAPTAGSYTWTYADTITEISHIQFYAGSNQWIADIDNLQNYIKIVAKKETSFNEFMTLDPLNRLYASNSLANAVPALRNSTAAVANPSFSNYTEPAYFNVGSVSNSTNAAQAILPANGAVIYNVQFPLSLIKNSIFSMDKALYLGQVSYLKLYFGPISKVCYISTGNAQPSANGPTAWAANATAGANNQITINNLQLLLAIENNPDFRQQMINQVASGGQSLIIPYVQSYKNSNLGAVQNISIQMDAGNGRSLVKMIHSVFNSAEQYDTAYDCNNCATGPLTQKVNQFYTQINGKRNQNITMDCTSAGGVFTDYMQMKRQLKGSVLNSLSAYQYNWHFCDDFSEFGADYDQNNNGELISGIPMGPLPLTWTFVGVSMAAVNNNFQHYDWAVFTKKLTMTPQLVTVQ
jgi:hypothetical protein